MEIEERENLVGKRGITGIYVFWMNFLPFVLRD